MYAREYESWREVTHLTHLTHPAGLAYRAKAHSHTQAGPPLAWFGLSSRRSSGSV
jgi:hypothetical protein